MLSHYHEAAYDAHMTAVVFVNILKNKEIEYIKNIQVQKEAKMKTLEESTMNSVQEAEQINDGRNMPIDLNSFYA